MNKSKNFINKKCKALIKKTLMKIMKLVINSAFVMKGDQYFTNLN